MARRNVVTARGFVLNFEELAMKAKKPLRASNIDLKDKIEPQKMPSRQINIAGFVPDISKVAKPMKATEQATAQLATPPEEPQPSMADLTGVTVDTPTRFKEKPADPTAAANETLREIITDLDQYKVRDATDNSKQTKKS